MVILFLLAILHVGIEETAAMPDAPLPLLITLEHPVEEVPTQFQVDRASVQPDVVNEETHGNTVTTRYRVMLPAQSKGLHLLPQVTVVINGKTLASVPSTYTLDFPPSDRPFFKLEAFQEGPTTLYPGQRTTLAYRYRFNTNVSLQKEDLPFLKPKGLRVIGEPQIKDVQDGSISTRTITLLVEAIQPGTLVFPSAFVEGVGPNGQKLRSEVPSLALNVLPFPTPYPVAFNGAIGQFTFHANPQTSSLQVGDPLQIQLIIKGKGTLDSLHPPDILCQPGFAGRFVQSDLPTTTESTDAGRVYRIRLRPITPFIEQIPSLYFSFFDPEKEEFVTLHSDPTPLRVESHASLTNRPPFTIPIPPPLPSFVSNAAPSFPLPPVGWSLLMALLVLFLFATSLKKRAPSARTMLKRAEKGRHEPGFYTLLRDALYLRQQEQFNSRLLPFLTLLEEQRFSGKPFPSPQELLQQIRPLFASLLLLAGTWSDYEATLNTQLEHASTSEEKGKLLDALDQPPYSLYYLRNAELEHPREKALTHYPRPWLSRPEKKGAALLSLLFVTLFAAWLLLRQNRWLWTLFTLSLLALMTSLTLLTLSPEEAVLLRASFLRQAPSATSPLVSSTPVSSATLVTILQWEGSWAKVETEEGAIGYMSQNILLKI